MIGTAPLTPAHEMKVSSRLAKPKPARLTSTVSGRATNTRTREIRTAGAATWSKRLGKTSSPISTNMPICDSQANPSWNSRMPRLAGIAVLPITIPAMYTARKPLPPNSAVTPNASSPPPRVNRG